MAYTARRVGRQEHVPASGPSEWLEVWAVFDSDGQPVETFRDTDAHVRTARAGAEARRDELEGAARG